MNKILDDSKKEIDQIANKICPENERKKKPKLNFFKRFKRKGTKFFPLIHQGTFEKNSFRKFFSKESILTLDEKTESSNYKDFNNKGNDKDKGNRVLNKLWKNNGLSKAEIPDKSISPISNRISQVEKKTSEYFLIKLVFS